MKTKITVVIFLLSLLVVGCKKESPIESVSTSPDKHLKIGITYSVTFKAGHYGPGPSCMVPGLGDVMQPGIPGVYRHVPCWWTGSACSHTVNINISLFNDGSSGKIELNKVYDAKMELIDEEGESVLPVAGISVLIENSIGTTGKQMWLNVLNQNASKISENSMFYKMEKGVIYTTNPMYTNIGKLK